MIKMRRQPPALLERICIALSLAFIAGAGIEGRQFRPPPDATGYLKHVKEVAEQMLQPTLILGDWTAKARDVDKSAVQLLHPNSIVSLEFDNTKTGEKVGLLFVDCSDARDTVGHYPPICYPSQGWSLQTKDDMYWPLPDMTVHGMEYRFVQGNFNGDDNLLVDDFFVLPGAGTTPDRAEVVKAAGDLQRRFYGVAQVQLVFFKSEYTSEERRRAIVEIIGPLEKLLHTVQEIKPDNRSGTEPVSSSGENVP
ncbi:MAG: hypothetical protein ABSH22_22455 [Tepidisphaeraceae bacterium]|jgi:hypothetical protein